MAENPGDTTPSNPGAPAGNNGGPNNNGQRRGGRRPFHRNNAQNKGPRRNENPNRGSNPPGAEPVVSGGPIAQQIRRAGMDSDVDANRSGQNQPGNRPYRGPRRDRNERNERNPQDRGPRRGEIQNRQQQQRPSEGGDQPRRGGEPTQNGAEGQPPAQQNNRNQGQQRGRPPRGQANNGSNRFNGQQQRGAKAYRQRPPQGANSAPNGEGDANANGSNNGQGARTATRNNRPPAQRGRPRKPQVSAIGMEGGEEGSGAPRARSGRPRGQRAQSGQPGQSGPNGQSNPFLYHKPPPIKTSTGIKSLSQDGNYALSWWAAKWIAAMELLVDGLRLSRGKSYAKEGQVQSIEEKSGGVVATVQGSRIKPYRVLIEVTPLSDREWEQVFDVLASQALFAAQLLAGEMPRNIEEAFQAAGTSLFPARLGDLRTDCSCPDWANPCKHVAATHYILAERFDEDPFLLFRLRGRTSEQILAALRERRAGSSADDAVIEEPPVEEIQPVVPLDANLASFYSLSEPLDDFPLSFKAPQIEMAVLKRLGDPNFLGQESLLATLEPVYRAVRLSALEAALGEAKEDEASE